jgi:hypothetical protein
MVLCTEGSRYTCQLRIEDIATGGIVRLEGIHQLAHDQGSEATSCDFLASNRPIQIVKPQAERENGRLLDHIQHIRGHRCKGEEVEIVR